MPCTPCAAPGRLKGNRHIVAKDTPTANLLLAISHLSGAEIDKLERVPAESIFS
jgi:hypothetical protein